MTKYIFLLLLSVTCLNSLLAQKKTKSYKAGKVISFNLFALAEPQAAAGLGFTKMVTARSGYFAELSYIFKAPFYGGADPVTGGYRLLLQYRYKLLKERRWNYFWGAEFRLKEYGFTGTNSFINVTATDTLNKYGYKANATSVGGALLFGTWFNISKNNRWQMEMTLGIGAKQKFVQYKNLPEGYRLYVPAIARKPDALRPPDIDEAVAMPYFPVALRFRYAIF